MFQQRNSEIQTNSICLFVAFFVEISVDLNLALKKHCTLDIEIDSKNEGVHVQYKWYPNNGISMK